ncbi:MAG TPA: DUF1345 domain-containing protein [Micropepsaceae bacterium]|nr:DUF1345 domain-containing protein [Micropepsaceae bacterium]
MTADIPSTPRHSLHRGAHLRRLSAIAVGVAVGMLAPVDDWAIRLIIGWDAGVTVLLLSIWHMMAKTTLEHLQAKAAQQDENAPVILAVMMAAVLASLGGVLAVIHDTRHAAGGTAIYFVLLSLATLVLSWLCMNVLFAIHYAHRYYGETEEETAHGLIFPEPQAAPNYTEFIYFAFCVGMTYQVSDVMTCTREFRKLVTYHGALSFFYNTFVLALGVSLLSGLSGLL